MEFISIQRKLKRSLISLWSQVIDVLGDVDNAETHHDDACGEGLRLIMQRLSMMMSLISLWGQTSDAFEGVDNAETQHVDDCGEGLELIMQRLSMHIIVRRVWGILLMSQY